MLKPILKIFNVEKRRDTPLFFMGGTFKSIIIIALISGCCGSVYGQEQAPDLSDLPHLTSASSALYPSINNSPTSYFYKKQTYGSESQFGPLNVFVNVGLVVPGRLTTTPNLGDIRYKAGWDNVVDSLSHQDDVFEESGGFGRSLEKEFIPFAHPSGAWLPNYSLHFLGEGMLSRKLEEYFRHSGMQGEYMPKILAASTVIAAQLMNEVVEYELPWEQRLDIVADFYFNMAGIIAFSFDGFAQYFSNDTVQYYYWPGQPVVDTYNGALFNQGESYFLRIASGTEAGWKYAFAMGMPTNGFGVSLPLDDLEVDYLTVMLGSDVLIPNRDYQQDEDDQRTGDFIAADIAKEYTAALNVYWDRKGSLMASSALSFSPSWQLNMNLYPDKRWGMDVGIGGYLVIAEEGANTIGLTFDLMSIVPGFRD
jgi:hypothetical protein